MTRDTKLFPFGEFESRWQDTWEKMGIFRSLEPDDPKSKALKKFYILDMFPYPSAAGLHVGHPEGYTATDILARYKRMQGFNVLHPMGWDAFGLPAEQYAIKTGVHPSAATQKNVENFKKQIKRLGFSYDWTREVNTTDPEYYRWTQWIFLKLFEKGLAYEAEIPVWWCEELGSVLANEEVIDGKSERGGHPVVKKPMRQWMLKITAYADRLLEDLEGLEWPEAIKEMQKNWVGRSVGAEAVFKVADGEAKGEEVKVFTTRPDTLFGATYMVLAPEHPLVQKIATPDNLDKVRSYINTASKKNELERTQLEKVKTGVFTGGYAVNPVSQEKIPVWIADYVLLSYGTGAIMAVPAHDVRDYEFAKKFNLKIREVISGGDVSKEAYQGEGACVASGLITGLHSSDGKKKIIKWLEEKKLGKKAINYKLRDWLFSRQRYWGEPIPVVHCDACGPVALGESELPLKLPDMKDFKPTGTAEPPLAKAKDWLKAPCPKCGKIGRRETNTMPQWAGSCWYYLRYLDPKNQKAPVSREKEKYWMNVDLYVGGAEHAVLHLLYARFWHKVLFDIGVVSAKEPFRKLVNQGIILGEDNQKMSKSRGNVVNPDEVIDYYGADSMRLYEMFMGPLEQSKAWQTRGVEGVYRFLGRVWRLLVQDDGKVRPQMTSAAPDNEELRIAHELIQKVTSDLDRMAFNTAISAFMIFLNTISKKKSYSKNTIEILLKLLSPFAPHIAEELWSRIGHDRCISLEPWPVFDESFVQKQDAQIVIQVNGKLRSKITVPISIPEEDLKSQALSDSKIKAVTEGKSVLKVIVVPQRLVNIVVK